MNPNLNLTRYTKLNTKWIIQISITQKTITLLKENRKKFFVIVLGEEHITPKTQPIKGKNTNKLNSSQFQILALLFTMCRICGKLLNFSEQKFSHILKTKQSKKLD